MEPPRDDQLIADLRALRPTPRPEFAAELDQRAAAGFPRRSRLRIESVPVFWTAMRIKRPARRLLLPAGGVALAAIAIATVVALNSGSGQNNNSGLLSLTNPKTPSAQAPAQEKAPAQEIKPFSQRGPASGSAASKRSAEPMYETEARVVPSAGSAVAKGSAEVTNEDFNASPRPRKVERSAEVVLGAEPEDVAGNATKVFEAVHANDGIVMHSSTRQGEAGEAGASFDLLIPSAKLPDALAAFSAIDEVRSRHEATADITAPTVSAAELLRESRARIDSLLGQLGEAETESEREAVEAELRHERRHASRLAAQLDHLHRRADLSRVSLRIVTGGSNESSGGGAWGIDDAFHDAGHILAVAAAVTVVGLAILGPIALIALLAWLTHRTWVRRERRRALS
ncbi:MAG: DUF4349 domain-containing protein [Solirubrobacterales bacterium]